MKLTAKTVAVLTLPDGKTDHIDFDEDLPGFGLRLRIGGGGRVVRTWVIQYRHAGRTRRMTLDAVLPAAQARAKAEQILAEVTLGRDPQGDKDKRRVNDQMSMRGAVEEYLKAKAADVRRRTLVEITRYLTGRYFKPLHVTSLDAITRKDIAARLVAITGESGSITAARARAAASSFFVWCLQMGLIEHNPVIGTIMPKDSTGRDRVLTDAELVAVWNASGDDAYGKIIKLLVLTACRRQEVGGMRWKSELDRERGTWLIPAERTKNDHEHLLPLPPAAWDIITTVPEMASRDQ